MKAKSDKRIRHSSTARNVARSIESRLKDRASAWETFKLPLEQLSEEWIEIMRDGGIKRLPLYYQGRLAGVRDMLRESLVRRHAEWRIFWRGGEYHSSTGPQAYDHAAVGSIARPDTGILTGTWSECSGGRHVWLGTDRPFYEVRP